MPIYEYFCSDCKKNFTVKRTVDERDKNPVPECQYCKGKNVEPVISSVSVITSKKS